MQKPLQDSVEQVSLALTGMLSDQKSKAAGRNPEDLTPAGYQFYANEANQILNNLAEYYREAGRAEVRLQYTPNPNPNPAPNNNANMNPNLYRPPAVPNTAPVIPVPVVNPANAGGVPIPTVNPYAGVNHTNHKEAARRFVASVGMV
jgi:hypothetical protein